MVASKKEKKRLFCPYCEQVVVETPQPYCQTCKVIVFYCPKCRKAVPRDKKICPHCGADIKG